MVKFRPIINEKGSALYKFVINEKTSFSHFQVFIKPQINAFKPVTCTSPFDDKFLSSSKVKMSGRLPWESDEEYFRRMVHAHKPVSDIVPSPDPQPLSGLKWQEEFWSKLTQKKDEPSCSTSTSLSASSSATGTRPKTSRRSSTRVTPPSDPEEELWIKALYEEPYKTPKWMINRAKRYDEKGYLADSDFIFFPVKGGITIMSKDKAPVTLDMELKTTADGKQYFWWGPKEELWHQLRKLDLKDPVIIAKIRKACSSNPEGPD